MEGILMEKLSDSIRQRLSGLKFRLEQVRHAWTIDDYWALLKFYVDILPIIVPAERCTVFVIEIGTEKICSMLGTGLQKMRIEPPKDKSIVGTVRIVTGGAITLRHGAVLIAPVLPGNTLLMTFIAEYIDLVTQKVFNV